MKYKSYALHNFRKIPQIELLTEEERFEIEVVGNVLPFKANNYVIDHLIDWDSYKEDPMYILTFPQKNMLKDHHFNKMAKTLKSGADRLTIKNVANEIRLELNPHPAGQLEKNVPEFEGDKLGGIQHKYRETMLFFPSQGQTCHAYCTFCFRWPQFVGMDKFKFAMKEAESMVGYLEEHPEITDVLFTGGDPMIMKSKLLATYIDAILEGNNNVKTIRIGSKALAYWPYKFTTDPDADGTLNLFKKVIDAGKHLAFMAHFNHYAELQTQVVKDAVNKIRETGAQIRTQSPVLKNINDHEDIWAKMWRKQVELGMIPYYFFVVRDTGAQHYFGITLLEAHNIFYGAYRQVSGICRTVRGPSMSAGPGKVHFIGTLDVDGEDYMAFKFIQARNPEWVGKPFLAKYNEEAIWLDDLEPAFDDDFFFESEGENHLIEEAIEFN